MKQLALMYHNVVEEIATGEFARLSPSITRYFVTEKLFAEHMHVIHDLAGEGVDVELTFDDGWRGSIEAVWPLLEQFDMTARVFVTTGLIGAESFADETLILEASQSQRFQFGTHGVTHRLLAELDDAEVAEELTVSKHRLEDLLGTSISTLAAPGGSLDRRVEEIAREAGYERIYTSRLGWNETTSKDVCRNRWAVLDSTSAEQISDWIEGRFQKQLWRQWGLDSMKSVLGKERYRQVRKALLNESETQCEMTDLIATSPVHTGK